MVRLGQRFALAGLGLGLSLVATPSQAQSISVTPATFTIVRQVPRSTGEFPYVINYDDCINSLREPGDPARTEIQIRPVLSGWDRTRDSLEVWVASSRDCTQNTERSSTGVCRMVARTLASATGQLLTIPPVDIVTALYTPGNQTDMIGQGTVEACEANFSSTLNMYIMFVASSDVKGKAFKWDKSQIDAAPPQIPTGLRVSPGDRTLFPNWNTVGDVDLTGFSVFCEQISCDGMVMQPDAGAAGAAGSGSIDASCPSTPDNLVPRERLGPDKASQYLCAQAAGRAASSATIASVEGARPENGGCYAIGLASKDIHGNLSRLSDISCSSPQDVTTFYEAYDDAGGKGGGGFCNFGAGPATSGLGFLSALLLALRRRARRAPRSPS